MIAVVTGASSGIGKEFVKQLDDKNLDCIWLIARRADLLEDLSKTLKTKSKIIALDLFLDKSFERFSEILKEEKPEISFLINSAGLGVSDKFSNISIEKDEETIRLNCETLTKLTKLSLDYMAFDSVIINIGSVAGFMPQANFAVYAASKSYVISFSRALNRELKDRNIHVSCLCPNPVKTEFFKNSPKKNASKIKQLGFENKEKLVEKSLRDAKRKDLITSSALAKLIEIVSKIFPHSWILSIEKLLKMY